VAQDQAEAVRYYRLAAEQGCAEAQCNLGTCFDNGDGIAQDQVEAVRYYRLAAEQGHASAQHNLGVCFENGEGVSQDQAEAVRYYRLQRRPMNSLLTSSPGSLQRATGSRARARLRPRAAWAMARGASSRSVPSAMLPGFAAPNASHAPGRRTSRTASSGEMLCAYES
jgi:hypothetical protein